MTLAPSSDRRALAEWALRIAAPEVMVMEKYGGVLAKPFTALEAVGFIAWVVNARHFKAVPGRKTDMADAQWLATLARAGLLRASFILPCSCANSAWWRQRQKLVGMCSAEPTFPGIEEQGAAMLLVEIGGDIKTGRLSMHLCRAVEAKLMRGDKVNHYHIHSPGKPRTTQPSPTGRPLPHFFWNCSYLNQEPGLPRT